MNEYLKPQCKCAAIQHLHYSYPARTYCNTHFGLCFMISGGVLL